MSLALIPNPVILICTCRAAFQSACVWMWIWVRVCVCLCVRAYSADLTQRRTCLSGWAGSWPFKQLLLIGSASPLELIQDWLSLPWHHQSMGAGHDVMMWRWRDVRADTLAPAHVLAIACNVHYHCGNVFNTSYKKTPIIQYNEKDYKY